MASDSVVISDEFRAVFNYADKTSSIDLGDWLSIVTLCLSPLIAHIISGVPRVVRRCPSRPSWLDYLCLYNPTTIIWRYLAIADRRARHHRSWNAADMAASNAMFWTSHGFDGSEEMMWKSRAFCTRVPDHNHTELLSTDAVKTVITTLQGIQALVVLIRGILAAVGRGNGTFAVTIAIDSIFYPLAIFGLLRLFAAPWLTEGYSYAEHDSYASGLHLAQPNSHTSLSYPLPPSAEESDRGSKQGTSTGCTSSMTILESSQDHSMDTTPSAAGNCISTTLRVCYLVLICGVLAISVCYIAPITGDTSKLATGPTTAVLWLLAAVYVIFSVVSITLFAIYLIRGRKTTTTVIPCIRTRWYQAYTLLLLASMITLIVLSGVYTRRTPCGKLTVLPRLYDQNMCSGTPVPMNSIGGPLGFMVQDPLLKPHYWLVPLEDGWCSGTLTTNKMFPFSPAS